MKPKKPTRKPRYYILELGLDAQVPPTADGTYPLIRSLARWDPATRAWVPAWGTEFQPGDWIVFRIFDYTPGATELTLLDPKLFEIHFLDPRQARQLRSPFSPTNPTENNPIIVDAKSLRRLDGVRSASTGAPIGWICSGGGDRKGAPFFPGELAHRFSTEELGRFLFHVLIEVTVTMGRSAVELRTYDHDPEIFVGEGDPPPHRG
jgi:hypothetical protein